MKQSQPSFDQSIASQTVNAPVAKSPVKSCQTLKIIACIMAIVAVAGIAFGIFGIIQCQSGGQQSICEQNSQQSIGIMEQSEENNASSNIKFKDVRSLLSKYLRFDYLLTVAGGNIFEDGITDVYKYFITINDIDYANRVTEDYSQDEYADYDYGYDITYDEVNDAYHNLFASSNDLQYQPEFLCGVPFFSVTYNKYVLNSRCGGTNPSSYFYEILDYFTEDDNLFVDVAYMHVFEDFYDETNSVTLPYILLNNGEKERYPSSGEGIMQRYIDRLPKYRLTFTQENGNYLLSDIEEI